MYVYACVSATMRSFDMEREGEREFLFRPRCWGRTTSEGLPGERNRETEREKERETVETILGTEIRDRP